MNTEENIKKILKSEFGTTKKSPFNEEGFDNYLNQISEYILQLYRLSLFQAKKDGHKIITSSTVEKCARKLHSNKQSKSVNLVLSISGIFIGLGLTHLVTLAITDSVIELKSVIIAVIFTSLGALGIGYYLFR